MCDSCRIGSQSPFVDTPACTPGQKQGLWKWFAGFLPKPCFDQTYCVVLLSKIVQPVRLKLPMMEATDF